MSGITDPPLNQDFGHDFNYAVWTPDTSIALVNVPWDTAYRDVVRFNNRGSLNAYIDERALSGISVGQLSYVKPNQPVRLDVPFNSAMKFNYLRASLPLQPVTPSDTKKDYYYFILGVNYLAPNTTEFILQLDVYQSFIYDVQFGNSYVERGHVGIANENQFDSFGRDYLTVPEGLDIGSDYRVVTKRTEELIDAKVESKHTVLVISTTNLFGPYSHEEPFPPEIPRMESAWGGQVHGLPTGASFFVWPSVDEFKDWMEYMRIYPWITQGIMGVYVTPQLGDYGTLTLENSSTWLDPNQDGNWAKTPNSAEYIAVAHQPQRIVGYSSSANVHSMYSGWRDHSDIVNAIPSRYRHLLKFKTSPYMMVEMTTWSATPVSLKPENWQSANAEVMRRLAAIPPNQRLQIIPRRYNSDGRAPESNNGDDFGDYLDVMTQVGEFPALPMVNNGGLSYLAANAHSINYQQRSADWSQTRALQGAQTSYDNSVRSSQLAAEQTNITNAQLRRNTTAQNEATFQQSVASGVFGAMGGGSAGAFAGGQALGGRAGGVAGAALHAGQSFIQPQISSIIGQNLNSEMYRSASSANSQRQTAGAFAESDIRENNLSLAEFAAKGDYANAIAAVNAKVQDAEVIQPSVSGQFGGDVANLAHGTSELSVRWKMIDDAAIRRIGEFWLRYGYAVHARMTPPSDMMVMDKFTYWKMQETYLGYAPMPETYKQTIRGIFEKGVTVWANPADLANPNFDFGNNNAIAGVAY